MPKIGEKNQCPSESDFVPNSSDENIRLKDLRKIRKRKRAFQASRKDVQTVLSGSWNRRENQIYLQFLHDNSKDFETEHQRRSTKVFQRLSQLLQPRTPEQCRTHHQKIQIRINSRELGGIIEYVSSKLSHQKKKKSIKTTPDQVQHLEQEGFLVVEGPRKEVKILLKYDLMSSW